MRTRDDVLREFLPESEWDDYDPQSVMERMADRLRALESQRDEYHKMWDEECLINRDLTDQILRLESQQAASEPVACKKCGGSGYAIDSERSVGSAVVGKKCDCGAVAYITNGDTPHPSAAAVPVTAEVSDIAMRVRLCAGAWTPSACLIGNVTADDLLSLTGFVIECAALTDPTTPTRGSDE